MNLKIEQNDIIFGTLTNVNVVLALHKDVHKDLCVRLIWHNAKTGSIWPSYPCVLEGEPKGFCLLRLSAWRDFSQVCVSLD